MRQEKNILGGEKKEYKPSGLLNPAWSSSFIGERQLATLKGALPQFCWEIKRRKNLLLHTTRGDKESTSRGRRKQAGPVD